MGFRRHNGFAGQHMLDDERAVRIEYFDIARVARTFGCSPVKRTRHNPIRYGWYWTPAGADTWRGPFTSSRRALQNARLDQGG